MSGESTTAEVSQNRIEVVRTPQRDIIINLTAANQAQVRDLVSLVSSGFHHQWPEFPQQGAASFDYKIDNPNRPRFFLKKRHLSHPDDLKEMLDFSKERLEEAKVKKMSIEEKNKRMFERRKDLAYTSLANEISMSPEIVDLLGSPEAIDAARQAGFESIEFVEPLVGVVEKGEEKGKAMIYNFIDGRKAETLEEIESLTALSRSLVEVFLKAGIVPADLNDSQFIIGTGENQGRVFVLDSELYFRDV